jgi:hypothetical protein
MLRLSWIGGTASRAQAFDETLDEAEIERRGQEGEGDGHDHKRKD